MNVDLILCHPVCFLRNVVVTVVLLFQLRIRHQYQSRTTEYGQRTAAIEELKNAFELAERASPGISELFIREMVHKLVPSVTESRIKVVMEKITG